MKILYAEGNFLQKGHQVLAFPATLGAGAGNNFMKGVYKNVPEIIESAKNMYNVDTAQYTIDPPVLGDVIWTFTSGRKYYAHCLVYDSNNEFSFDAFDLCMKSVSKKCLEIGHDQVGMPLFGSEHGEMLQRWNRLYPMIEEIFKETAQVFVYVPEIAVLEQILIALPGETQKFYVEPQIRFKTTRQ